MQKICVVSRVGSDKSIILIDLMPILVIHERIIAIDGVDIYTLDLQTLVVRFNVIICRKALFSGTVHNATPESAGHGD
jgi:ABC-type multidrug transport system fused ATPase/permease subunit